jgi:hypothetical protein
MAADRPTLQPTRDVVVEYHILSQTGAPPGAPRPDSMKVYFSANGTRMRIEPGGQPAYIVMDRTAKRMEMIMPSQRSYMELPYDAKQVESFSAAEGSTFTRKGSNTIAGIKCTVWDVQSPQGNGSACITDDGVMLRAEGQDAQHHGGGMEATSVVYGAQPAGLFMPPDGFRKMGMPAGMGAPPGAPGGRPPG